MLRIDNRLMTAIGLTPARIAGHLTAPRAPRARVGQAGTAGQIIGARGAAPESYIEIDAWAKVGAFPDRAAVLDAVEQAYGGGALRTIWTFDRPGVLTRVLLDDCQCTEIAAARGLTIPRFRVSLKFLRIDGGSVDWPAPGPVLLGTSRVAVPVGSLPSVGQLLAWGGSSPLLITYTPANGLAATVWTITQAVASDEHLAADLETGDVFLVATTGTRTRVSGVTGTIPALDNHHRLGSVGPGLTLSSGNGLLLPTRRYRQ